MFDIATQYKTLFRLEGDHALAHFLQGEIFWFMDLLEAFLLPRIKLHKTLSTLRIDASALVQIIRQGYHASTTLKRLGAEFSPAILPIVNDHMEQHLRELADRALLDFQVELDRYDWIPSTALANTATTTTLNDGSTATATTQGGDWLVPSALELCRHRPLAVLTNSLIILCNELRQCALYHIRHEALKLMHGTLISVVGVMRSVHQSPGTALRDQEINSLMKNFATLLVPLVGTMLPSIFIFSMVDIDGTMKTIFEYFEDGAKSPSFFYK